MATSTIKKVNEPVISTVTLSYNSANDLRNENVTVPTGKSIDNITVCPLTYTGLHVQVQRYYVTGTKSLIAVGSGFSVGDSINVKVAWL